MIRLYEKADGKPAIIKIVGVGGSGISAISALFHRQEAWSDLIAIDSDRTNVDLSSIQTSIIIGNGNTHDPASKLDFATVNKNAIGAIRTVGDALVDADMVFVLAGLGGATGTGAAPVVCRVAHKMGALTVAIVTTPFSFEGRERRQHVNDGLEKLDKYADVIIVIPLARLSRLYDNKLTPLNAFNAIGNPLGYVVKCIGNIMMVPGYLNVDFATVKSLLSGKGRGFYSSGMACGIEKSINATRLALTSPLLPRGLIKKAKYALVNVTGGQGMTITEADEAVEHIKTKMQSDARIVCGMMVEPALEDHMRVSMILADC